MSLVITFNNVMYVNRSLLEIYRSICFQGICLGTTDVFGCCCVMNGPVSPS